MYDIRLTKQAEKDAIKVERAGLKPKASKPQDISTTGGQFTSVIAVDTDSYRRFYENKSVKKTLTIPMWLNERAEQANVNFSGVLQSALKELLHVQE